MADYHHNQPAHYQGVPLVDMPSTDPNDLDEPPVSEHDPLTYHQHQPRYSFDDDARERNGMAYDNGSRSETPLSNADEQNFPAQFQNESSSNLSSYPGSAQYAGSYGGARPISFGGSSQEWARKSGFTRRPTRKVKIPKGEALAIEYPVPSAVQNVVQQKYREDDLETGNTEFTHLRCKLQLRCTEEAYSRWHHVFSCHLP